MQVFWILVLLLQHQEEIPMSVKGPTEVFVCCTWTQPLYF